jgi:hypothetical protein
MREERGEIEPLCYAFGVDLQRACDIVILSMLLQHHYLDHLDRLPSGRTGAA